MRFGFSSQGTLAKAASIGVTVYKICDLVDGKIKTLFHGQDGSKVLQRNKWLIATRKWVSDGTSKTSYVSGWHVFKELADAKRYLEKFQNLAPKVIVRCQARFLSPKGHSPSPVMLAERLFVQRIVWRAQQGGA